MQIRDVMTPDVELIAPNSTIRDAACIMRAEDIGAIPVGDGDRLIGMITDRDIVVRCVAESHDPGKCRVRDAMSGKICYCFEDQNLEQAADLMAEHQIRRLPVLSRNKRLVGMISLADLIRCDSHVIKSALEAITEQSTSSRRMTH